MEMKKHLKLVLRRWWVVEDDVVCGWVGLLHKPRLVIWLILLGKNLSPC